MDKNNNKPTNKPLSLDLIAEQWVNLTYAHILSERIKRGKKAKLTNKIR